MKKKQAPKRVWVSYCTKCGQVIIADLNRQVANSASGCACYPPENDVAQYQLIEDLCD
jgi:hypothetical protein